MKKSIIILISVLTAQLYSCQTNTSQKAETKETKPMETSYKKTDEEWKKQLTPEQYNVLREKGTERPFTGKYTLTTDKGIYTCAGCNTELFTSDQKFDSHCGWPSFDNEIGKGEKILKIKDSTLGMARVEIVCAKCGGHLGHIFDDGPTETGQRYCVNSLSLDFKPADKK